MAGTRGVLWTVAGVLIAAMGTGCSGEANTTRAGAGTENTGAAPTSSGSTPAQTADPVPARAPSETIFAASYGDEGEQSPSGLVADPDGNSYVVGNESQAQIAQPSPTGLMLDGLEGTANDSFVIKYDAKGSARWVQPFTAGPGSFIGLTDIALQPTTGAVIVVGWVVGTVAVDNDHLTSGTDAQSGAPIRSLWLTALDTAGYVVWSRVYVSPSYVNPTRVFVTASGDIEVVGESVGGSAAVPNSRRTFVTRYGSKGDTIWSLEVTGDFTSFGSGADPAGDVALGGYLTGTMTFAGQTLTVSGPPPTNGVLQADGVVLRISGDGTPSWIKAYTGPGFASTAASLDVVGNVILFGEFSDTLDLGNGQVLNLVPSPSQTTEGFLAKLAPDGTAQWARALPVSGLDRIDPATVATDPAGGVAFAGTTTGGVDFPGASPSLPVGAHGNVVALYDANGSLRWSRSFPVTTSPVGAGRLGLSFDGGGNLSFGGYFDNTVDFGTGPLTAPGLPSSPGAALPAIPDNIFLVKLAR